MTTESIVYTKYKFKMSTQQALRQWNTSNHVNIYPPYLFKTLAVEVPLSDTKSGLFVNLYST